jgi:hypothetical protein
MATDHAGAIPQAQAIGQHRASKANDASGKDCDLERITRHDEKQT